MFGKILYISDNVVYLENKDIKELNGDLLNIHLIFEHISSLFFLGFLIIVAEFLAFP